MIDALPIDIKLPVAPASAPAVAEPAVAVSFEAILAALAIPATAGLIEAETMAFPVAGPAKPATPAPAPAPVPVPLPPAKDEEQVEADAPAIQDATPEPIAVIVQPLPSPVGDVAAPTAYRDRIDPPIFVESAEMRTIDPPRAVADAPVPPIGSAPAPLAVAAAATLPDRGTPPIAVAVVLPEAVENTVRDLVSVTRGDTLRFAVVPDAVGPVDVEIRRGEDGASLRIGVEEPRALAVVRETATALAERGQFTSVHAELMRDEGRARPRRMPARSMTSLTQAPPSATDTKGRFA